MKKIAFVLVVLGLTALIGFSFFNTVFSGRGNRKYAKGMMGGNGMMGGGSMMGNMSIRHSYVMKHGVDPKYKSISNPLQPTEQNVVEGKNLYFQNCVSCHGPNGLGNGPLADTLNPPPANIAASVNMPMVTDGYLYWTIAEGGSFLHTGMPQFKGRLNEDQIWKVILFIRQFPEQ